VRATISWPCSSPSRSDALEQVEVQHLRRPQLGGGRDTSGSPAAPRRRSKSSAPVLRVAREVRREHLGRRDEQLARARRTRLAPSASRACAGPRLAGRARPAGAATRSGPAAAIVTFARST